MVDNFLNPCAEQPLSGPEEIYAYGIGQPNLIGRRFIKVGEGVASSNNAKVFILRDQMTGEWRVEEAWIFNVDWMIRRVA